jgi:hypothetical protein
MADLIFNKAKEYIGDGTIDLDNDALKIMLLAVTYTPNAAHSVKADIVAHELAGASGYSTGGYALQNITWTESGGVVTLDADDPVWNSATFTARYAVVYDDTPVSPADPLICLLDFLANKTGQGGNFYINFHTNGIVRVT